MKIKQTVLTIALLIGVCGFATVLPVSAATCGGRALKPGESCCGGVATSIIACTQSGGGGTTDTGLWALLLLIVNILSVGVGIAAVGGVVWGSILYTTSGGSVEQTKKARTIIANTIVGIVLYVSMWAFLNFMIPGGMFK